MHATINLRLEHAAAVARGQGTTLCDALAWYRDIGRSVREAPPLETCVGLFLRTRIAACRRPATVKGYRHCLTRFACAFAGRPPVTVQPAELRQFLLHWSHAITRHTVWKRVFTFCAWLVEQRWLFDNPVPIALAVPRRQHQPGSVYTPDEAAAILQLTRDTDQLGYWVLALFAGLRQAEIRRLAVEPLPWTVIRPESEVIDLPAALTKNRPRVVPIEPVLQGWLSLVRERRLALYPPDGETKLLGTRALLRRGAPHGPGTRNLARRSYISYRLALPGASYDEVAQAAGNSEPSIRRYYRTVVTARRQADLSADVS